MSEGFPPHDPRWPRLLALAVHEFRTPVTVVAGYIRMLLKDRAGPLSDQQRRLLEEAEKSCGRLSGLTGEMSDLANLEAGTATFNMTPVELGPLIEAVIASLPPLPDADRDIAIRFENRAERSTTVEADAARLKAALGAVLIALRRELVTSRELVVRLRLADGGGTRLAIAAHERVDALDGAAGPDLTVFDEWRGGCGLSLAIARRVLSALGGRLWSPAEDSKAGAVIEMPGVRGAA